MYVRDWREKQRAEKRKTVFVNEYVRVKFSKVYSEAINFYTALDQIPLPSTMPPQPTANTVETQTETTGETSTTSQLDTPSEIQQSLATPPEIGAELTIEIPPIQPETPLETDEEITDRRIQELIAELRDDPDLNGIFDDLETNNQTDEGIEVPTPEQEFETDIGLIENEIGSYLLS